jgi:hypothetical protein
MPPEYSNHAERVRVACDNYVCPDHVTGDGVRLSHAFVAGWEAALAELAKIPAIRAVIGESSKLGESD